MALPVGIDVAVVTFGQAVSYSGRTTSARLVVKPSVRLVYGGVPILDFPESSVAGAGQPGQMFLPVCDQSGFKATQNGVVVDFTGWSYTGTLTWTEDLTKETRQVTKIFQVLTGQSTIDFDELPDTVDALPVTAPVSGVTSFLGKTGAVTEEDLAELDLGGGLGDAGIADLVTTPGTELATALANSYAPVPSAPVADKTYGLKLVSGVLQWVEVTAGPVTPTDSPLYGAGAYGVGAYGN